MRKNVLASAVAVTALMGGGLFAGAATASAVTDGSKAEVCANNLALRTEAKPNGPDQGELRKGDHVLVHYHAANGMLYVFAYGQLNRDGYVDDGHFC